MVEAKWGAETAVKAGIPKLSESGIAYPDSEESQGIPKLFTRKDGYA